MNYGQVPQFDGIDDRPLRQRSALPHEDGDGADFDVRGVVSFLWRSKVKIIIGALLGGVLALMIAVGGRPEYTSRAKVLFSPEQRNVVDIEGVLPAADDRQAVANQLEILRSTMLLDRVVERMSLWRYPDFNPQLVRRKTLMEHLRPFLNWRTYVPWQMLADFGVITPAAPPRERTEEEILARQALTARNLLSQSFTTSIVPGTRVLHIGVTTGRPDLSADIANAIAREYITAQLDTKLAATREATRWLSERVGELEADVSRAEAAVNAFTNQLADRVGQTSSVMRQQLEALNSALANARARLAQARARYDRASAAAGDAAIIGVVAEFQGSETISSARERERELVSSRAELVRLVSENHERVRLLDSRIEATRAEIRSEAARIVDALESELRSAEGEVTDLSVQVRGIEQRLLRQGDDEVRLRQLEREAEANRLIYENFLSRLKETTQQQELEEADAVILSPAEPRSTADTSTAKRIVAIGLILGSGFGLGTAVLLERLNNTFRTVEEIQNQTGLMVLGMLPAAGRQATRQDILSAVLAKPTSALPEAVRSLRTSVLFSNVDRPPQVIMLTSSVASEGKSTTGLLLATTSAQMGKSAVIVDCDLRRPSLHAFFGEKAGKNSGIRGVLDGSLTLDEAMLVDEASGLTVLTNKVENATVINAADVLASDRFGEMVDALRSRFDLVILDTPPVLAVTDAQIISRRADCALYVVKWDATPRDLVLEGLRNFRIVYPNIAGIAVTMVDSARVSGYGYRYGGYYGRYENPYVTG